MKTNCKNDGQPLDYSVKCLGRLIDYTAVTESSITTIAGWWFCIILTQAAWKSLFTPTKWQLLYLLNLKNTGLLAKQYTLLYILYNTIARVDKALLFFCYHTVHETSVFLCFSLVTCLTNGVLCHENTFKSAIPQYNINLRTNLLF